jgi:hypothetical protein
VWVLSLSRSLALSLTFVLETRHDGHGVTYWYRSIVDLGAGGFQLRSAQLGRMGRRPCHYAASRRTALLRAFFTICPAQYGQVRTVQPHRGPEGRLYLVPASGVLPFCVDPRAALPLPLSCLTSPRGGRTSPLGDEPHAPQPCVDSCTILSYFRTLVRLPSHQQSHCPRRRSCWQRAWYHGDRPKAGREQQPAFLNGHRQRWGRRLKGVYRLFEQPC